MRGAGISDISEAEIRDDKKGQFYVAKIEKAGRASTEIISELIPDVMGNFPWPKSMKSGVSTFRWVRPLTSMICLLDGNIIPVEVGGIMVGNETRGHRRHGLGPYKVKSHADYKQTLEGEGHVLLEIEDRKAKILRDAKAACEKAGLELVEDAGLLSEVAGLAEWPVVLLCDMDQSFLELPEEVIRLTLKGHQKTFTVRDPKTGKLAAKFIIVANQIAPDGGEAIKKGNGKVIGARLSDAQFFQSEDAKSKLIDYYDKLDTVVFHKKLGSIKDKAERVAALARELAPKVGADSDMAEQAAKLSKCDLVTQTVIEFTSLQGQIGRLMYEKEGGDKDIAAAIEEHYKPQGPSDHVPTNPVSIAVALADKLDMLVAFWAIDEKPTGSKDPFALRRAALGVVRIILENDIRYDLSSMLFDASFQYSINNLKKQRTITKEKFRDAWTSLETINVNVDVIKTALSSSPELPKSKDAQGRMLEDIRKLGETSYYLENFILDRFNVHCKDNGIEYDCVNSVSQKSTDLVAIFSRLIALQAFLKTDDGANLLAGYKRAANILKAEAKKGDLPEGDPNEGTQAQEGKLYKALQTAKPKIDKALEKEDYAGAMTALSALRTPIDNFFDGVMVNSKKEQERQNRLRLLQDIRATSRRIANFDKIDG